MRTRSAALLFAILTVSILTSWIPEGWPTAILEAGAFLLGVAWIAKFAIAAERPRLAAILAPAAFFVAWGLLQLACHWTVAASETVRAVLGWAANLTVLFIAIQTFDDPILVRRFLHGLLWLAFLISIAGIVQRFASHDKDSFSIGPFLYHNHFAAFIEIVLPVALLQREKRVWYAFVSATMIAAVIVAASRSGVALILLETAVVLVINRKPALISATAIAVLTAMIGWDSLATRLHEEHPYYDRLQMLRSSVEMFRDHPLAGVGLGNWPIVFPSYARYDDGLFANQAHNDWAQSAAEAGIPGLAAFAAFFVLTVRQARRTLWLLGLVFVFLHAMVDYPFHNPQIAALVCILCAIPCAPKRSCGELRSPQPSLI